MEFLLVEAVVVEASMAKTLVLRKAVNQGLMELLDAHLPVLMVKTRADYSDKIQLSLKRLMVNQTHPIEKKSIALMRIGWVQPAQLLHREA